MTVDLLGPISTHIAQIAENAFEEEQPEYAIESLKIAFQMGMYPTRDLFLATLAVIISSPDLKQRISIAKQRKKEAEKSRRYNKFQLKDIDKQTIISAIELVNDLVRTCPNAIRRYLPPFPHEHEVKGQYINKKNGSKAEEIEWQKEQRNWLRRTANSEGPSSPEDSRTNSRNRSPAVITNPIIALAVQMLECNDVFALLTLNASDMQDLQRFGRDKIAQNSREGDGEKEIYAREAELRKKFDRPGTWILLGILCSFWDQDLEAFKKASTVKGTPMQRPHLAKQMMEKVPERSPPSRASKGNDKSDDILVDALDLIKVGLLPSMENITSKKEKSVRDSKSVTACHLLRLLESIAAIGGIKKETLINGLAFIIERIDSFALEKMNDTNLLVSETAIFARSAMRHLKQLQDDDASPPWDVETADRINDCLKDTVWDISQKKFLRAFQEGLWLLHKVDWATEEAIEFWRLTHKGTVENLLGTINGFLSQDTWQIRPSKAQAGRQKKRNSNNTDSSKETEDRMHAFTIASEIKRRIADSMITHTQLQLAILQCMQQHFVKPNPDRAYLALISAKAFALLAQNIESDLKVIRKCLEGMQDTYKQILEDEVFQGENTEQGESKKRRRTGYKDEENQTSTVSPEKSLQFVVEWTQIEKKIKRYIMILEAAAFSVKPIAVNRERDSLSSDLTELTEE